MKLNSVNTDVCLFNMDTPETWNPKPRTSNWQKPKPRNPHPKPKTRFHSTIPKPDLRP